MKRLVAAIAALGLVPAPSFAQDGNAQVYKPSGGWTADFGDDYCRLIRNFSNGTSEITLSFDRTQPWNMLRVIIIADEIRFYRSANAITYSYLPSGADRTGQLLQSRTDDDRLFLNIGYIAMSEPIGPPRPGDQRPLYDRTAEVEFAAGVSGLSLTGGLVAPIQIETGPLKTPVEVMQTCTDDLLAFWGLDSERHKTLTAWAKPASDTTRWLPTGTIPFAEFGKLNGGANEFRLLVDEQGKPTSCSVHFPSLEESLNGRICDSLMKNAEFDPALDAEGKPFASYWTGSAYSFMAFPGGT